MSDETPIFLEPDPIVWTKEQVDSIVSLALAKLAEMPLRIPKAVMPTPARPSPPSPVKAAHTR